MLYVVGRRPPGRALIVVILNGCSSTWSIFDVEETAAGVLGFTPGVSHQRAEPIGKSLLELCFQGPVISPAGGQSVINAGADPGHSAKLIDLRCEGSLARVVS